MKILIACDKFKGSLTAGEACAAVRDGIVSALQEKNFSIQLLPIADGGDGIARSLTEAQSGEWISLAVLNALGSPVEADFGLINQRRTAVIEMAEASGLAQLEATRLEPRVANTFGTGQLIRAATGKGVDKIILGIGGSATNDAGTGMALALGWKFRDESGEELASFPADLPKVREVIPPEGPPLPEIIVACDVVNPLLGPDGCTRTYGPQKGIEETDFAFYEAGLSHLVSLLGAEDIARSPGAGAAGGLGFGGIVFLNATLTPGFELVSEILGLEKAVSDADLIITGEGRLDRQSLEGKAPFGVARLAREKGKPLVTFCGITGDEGLEEFFGRIIEIRDPALSIGENIARGKAHLTAAAKTFGESLLR